MYKFVFPTADGKGATNAELAMISEKIFAIDVNRLPENDYKVNHEDGKALVLVFSCVYCAKCYLS